MKLLAPRELNTKIQEQKSSEFKAGLFLAKKIDRLREELADAQKLHDDSITGMKKEYEIFLQGQIILRDKIIKEIIELEEERKLLRIPLDEEWKEVERESSKNSTLSFELIEKEFALTGVSKELKVLEDNLKKREEKIEISEERSRIYLEFTEQQRNKTEDILNRTKQYETETTEELKIRTEAVQKRETDIAYREVDVENRLKNALSKEESNRKETLHIESKQRQLKVALDLLKNAQNK